jgi:hypothetical protein
MLGTTTFRIGLRPGAAVEDLLFNWERFALPLRESTASGGGHLPSSGTLLDVAGSAVLSNVRRRDGAVEARMWNPSADLGIDAIVAGRPIHLGPARIETVRASRA